MLFIPTKDAPDSCDSSGQVVRQPRCTSWCVALRRNVPAAAEAVCEDTILETLAVYRLLPRPAYFLYPREG